MKPPPPKKKTKATQSSEALSEDAYISHAGVISYADVNKDNYLDFTAKDVTRAEKSVRVDFDEVAAQNLIRYFHYRLKNGCLFDDVRLKPKERAFIDYVEHAFARMVEQKKSPEVAFGLAPGKGEHRRESTVERDVQLAAYAILHMRSQGANPNKEKAFDAAAVKFYAAHGGKPVAKAAYRKYERELKSMTDKSLEELLSNESETSNDNEPS